MDRDFVCGSQYCHAPTGLLIPPSNVMITYSLVSGGTSVAACSWQVYTGNPLGTGVYGRNLLFCKEERIPQRG